MTKNLIPEAVKLLGLEIGEKFQLRHFSSRATLEYEYAINGVGNLEYFDNGMWGGYSNISLQDLLGGAYEIIKLKWKPKTGEVFWTFLSKPAYNGIKMKCELWEVEGMAWLATPCDIALFDKGWVYRTQAEAEAALPEVAKELGVEYEL